VINSFIVPHGSFPVTSMQQPSIYFNYLLY